MFIEENDVWTTRTDLAYDEVVKKKNEKIEGLIEKMDEYNGIKIYYNKISKPADSIINKKEGTYYTIDLSNVDFHDVRKCEDVEKVLCRTLMDILDSKNLRHKKCLLVGLGNINVTPDSLGPYVMDNVVVTRHLVLTNNLKEGFSEVSAISPGVMGNTGIETFDIIHSVVKEINVDYLIVVDALASNSIERVNKTIQITDTGISPGSGVGNKRKELSLNSLGIPVIAIGVPTVVDAVTITSDTIEYIINNLTESFNNSKDSKKLMLGKIGLLNEEEKKDLIKEILTPNGKNMMVTPKEVDADIEDLSKIISMGIDLALHQALYESKNI